MFFILSDRCSHLTASLYWESVVSCAEGYKDLNDVGNCVMYGDCLNSVFRCLYKDVSDDFSMSAYPFCLFMSLIFCVADLLSHMLEVKF